MEEQKEKIKLRKLGGTNKHIGTSYNMFKTSKNETRGITLIALVITIVLNCWRSGRNKVNNLLKYKKMILKNNITLENT